MKKRISKRRFKIMAKQNLSFCHYLDFTEKQIEKILFSLKMEHGFL